MLRIYVYNPIQFSGHMRSNFTAPFCAGDIVVQLIKVAFDALFLPSEHVLPNIAQRTMVT